jgi:tetratricopeptide (TPR) repeat protein
MRALCGALLCASAALAGGPHLDEGNRALADGRYADAIRAYLLAQESDGPSAELLANLGSAYAKSGDSGRAVLSYEQALLLAPREGAIRAALREVRRRAGVEGEPDRGWRDYHRYLTRGEWIVIVLSAGTVLLLALWRGLPRRTVVRLAGTGFLLALPAGAAVVKHALDGDRAVIVAAAEMRLSPHAAAEPAGTLRAGETVRIVRQTADYALVRGGGGRSGWVVRSSVEPITP